MIPHPLRPRAACRWMIPRALPLPVALLLAALTLAAGGAEAQETGLNVQQFEPAPSAGTDFVHVHGGRGLSPLQPTAGLVLSYAHRPLVFSLGGESVDLVGPHLSADLVAALGLTDGFQLGVGLPVTLYQRAGSAEFFEPPPIEARGLGDLRLTPRWGRQLTEAGLYVAVMADVTLPTGDPASYQGDPGVTVEPRLAVEQALGALRLAANLGYLLRNPSQVYVLEVDDQLTFGLAASYELRPDELTVLAEVFGRVSAAGGGPPRLSGVPAELTAAVKWRPLPAHTLTAGVGPGLTSGYGTPRFRAYVGYAFTPPWRDPTDTDFDGLRDAEDRCPEEAEDFDGRDDFDGCPDLDDDGDGVRDAVDVCPDDPEDRDGFADLDGCPDFDNDEDGVLDPDDRCPRDPEDRDGFQDEDGCPDLDDDQDGFPDASDACPREPEVINGFEDTDGCPDEGRSLVKVTATRIEILEKVFFAVDEATIQPESFPVLDQVASVLLTWPSLTRLRVEGHTDDQGSADHNKGLSQARAEAVAAYLASRGVDPGRLEAVGYGEERPLEAGESEEARARNRRVEFHILEVDGQPVEGPVIIETEVPVAP